MAKLFRPLSADRRRSISPPSRHRAPPSAVCRLPLPAFRSDLKCASPDSGGTLARKGAPARKCIRAPVRTLHRTPRRACFHASFLKRGCGFTKSTRGSATQGSRAITVPRFVVSSRTGLAQRTLSPCCETLTAPTKVSRPGPGSTFRATITNSCQAWTALSLRSK
jgi:hypothetical protein